MLLLGKIANMRHLFVFLSLAMILLFLYEVLHTSPVVNEFGRIASGNTILRYGDNSLFHVNPPLPNALSAFPAFFLRAHCLPSEVLNGSQFARLEYKAGDLWVEENGNHILLLNLGRVMTILIVIVGGLLIYLWSQDLYSCSFGIMSTLLWFSSPYIFGFGCLVCPDVPSSILGMAAACAFHHWLKAPTSKNVLISGIALGLSELTKFTLLIFYPLFLCLLILYHIPEYRNMQMENRNLQIKQIMLIFALSLLVINMGYCFEGTGKLLGHFKFQTTSFTGCKTLENVPSNGGNRFEGTLMGHIPMPLPANYIQGIDTQRLDFEGGLPSYLRGEWSDHGWWYFYLYALLIKTPLGTLGLFVLAIYCTFFIKETNASWRDEMVVLLPGIVILVFVSSQTGFSIHSRYAIPALPFFFIWMSKVGKAISWQRPVFSCLVALLLLWSVGSSLWVYPHSISYFNELAAILPTPHDDEFPIPQLYSETDPPWAWNRIKQTLNAGPLNGPRHLLDSNIDWGQDLFYLERWCKDHPEITGMRVACWGSYPVSLTTIPDRGLPPADEPQPGWYALSVNYLCDREGQYRYFLKFQPVAIVGYSIYVYHIPETQDSEGGSAGGTDPAGHPL